MSDAATRDFALTRNADWLYSARLKKADDTYHDLVGTTMRIQVRPDDDSDEVVIELNQDNGRLVFSAAEGDAAGVKTVWSIIVDKAVMRRLPKGSFIFDAIWSVGSVDRRFLAGAVTIENGATQ